MKSNTPNTEFEKKIFAKLPNFSIVGNSVSQNYELDQIITSTQKTVAEQNKEESPITTTPSLIKGDKGDKGDKGERGDRGEDGKNGEDAEIPKPPKQGTWIFGAINGELKWFETESCG